MVPGYDAPSWSDLAGVLALGAVPGSALTVGLSLLGCSADRRIARLVPWFAVAALGLWLFIVGGFAIAGGEDVPPSEREVVVEEARSPQTPTGAPLA